MAKIKWEKLHGEGFLRRAVSWDKNQTYMIIKGCNKNWIAQRLTQKGEFGKRYTPISGLEAKTVKELKKLVQEFEEINHFIKEV